MRIIISPAKEMTCANDFVDDLTTPVLLDKAKEVYGYMKSLSYADLQKLLKCNDKLALLNYDRYQSQSIDSKLTAAIVAYDGIAFKYMAPQIFTDEQFAYVNTHLRILSGLYGILRPFDGIILYRLEMQAKAGLTASNSLYEYWGDAIYKELVKDTECIVNLASAEYAKVIEPYVTDDITYVTIIFGEEENGKLIEKGVYVKMARGTMVRYMAENNITDIEQIKEFQELNYVFDSEERNRNLITLRFKRKKD